MKESDVITRSDREFEVLTSHVDAVINRAIESYWNTDYPGLDAVELAAFLDEELRKDGIAMKFAWLWSRAVTALNE